MVVNWSKSPAQADPDEPAPVNGSAATVTLTYLGFALQLLQAGIVPLLPVLGHQLHLSAFELSWLLTAGLLSGALVLAVITRLADLFGKRAMMLAALAAVLAGSVLGCFARDYTLLLLARVLMGAQLPMLALPEAVASDTMPRRRAQVAIAAIHAGTGVGIAGGILLAALVGAHPSAWPAYFYVSAAVTAVGIIATLLTVRESPARARGGIDVAGAALLATGLVSVLLGLSEGPSWGWGSGGVILLLAAGVVLLAGWLAETRRARFPLLPWRSMTNPAVSLAYAVTFFVAFGVYGSLSAFTRYATAKPAVTGYGWSYSIIGTAWFALPQLIGASLCVVAVTLIARRFNQGVVTAAGGVLCILGYLGFALLASSHPGVMAAVAVYALGTGIALAGAQLLIVRTVPAEESGIALGVSIMMYAIGQSFGTAVVGVLFRALTLPSGLPSVPAFTTTFAVCAVASALAVAAGLAAARAVALRSATAGAGQPATVPGTRR
jgi:MFS family permease